MQTSPGFIEWSLSTKKRLVEIWCLQTDDQRRIWQHSCECQASNGTLVNDNKMKQQSHTAVNWISKTANMWWFTYDQHVPNINCTWQASLCRHTRCGSEYVLHDGCPLHHNPLHVNANAIYSTQLQILQYVRAKTTISTIGSHQTNNTLICQLVHDQN